MKAQVTETEIRGKLTKEKFDELFGILKTEGKLTDHYNRLSIDLSPGFDPACRTWKNSSGTDIRLKKSGDKEKISIKSGNFFDKERREIEVKIQCGQFLSALDLLEAMGYKTGMVYFWESWEFEYQGVEIKLSKYSDDYFTFEIEGRENHNVELVADNFGLTPYTREQYREAIDWENQNIHQVYDRQGAEKILQTKFDN